MKLHVLPALAGVAALAAVAVLSGCAPRTPGHPEASSEAAPATADTLWAGEGWETGANPLARIGGPDTHRPVLAESRDTPRPADPHDLIGPNWPGNAADVYQAVGADAADGKLAHENIGAKSRATAGEVADQFLSINGGRVAESLGITPITLGRRGLYMEDVFGVLAEGSFLVADTEKLITGDVAEAQRAIDACPSDCAQAVIDFREDIAHRYKTLTASLLDTGAKLLNNPRFPLPSRTAPGARTYAVASPSGKGYAVNASGTPRGRTRRRTRRRTAGLPTPAAAPGAGEVGGAP